MRLSQASEMEHAICLQYLYAAFSMKKDASEGNLSPDEAAFVQDAASVLLLIARQEMEHLNLVCNILTAIGCPPHLKRPPLPQPAQFYGELEAFQLTRFSKSALERFIEIEKPEHMHLEHALLTAVKKQPGQGPLSLEAMLEQFMGVSCTEGSLQYAEAWLGDEHDSHVGSNWHSEGLNVPAFQKIQDQFRGISLSKSGITSSLLATALRKPNQLHSGARVEEVLKAPRRKLARQADLNTTAIVPIIVDGKIAARLVFVYKTYAAKTEDDLFLKALFRSLNPSATDGTGATKLSKQIEKAARLSMETKSLGGGIQQVEKEQSPRNFTSLGGFYRALKKQIQDIHGRNDNEALFLNDPKYQVTDPNLGIDLPGWKNMYVSEVNDLESALAAIDQIIEEGEGSSIQEGTQSPNGGLHDNHYARFVGLKEEYDRLLKINPDFDPARQVISNPFFENSPYIGWSEGRKGEIETPEQLTNSFAIRACDLFDGVYELSVFLLIDFMNRDQESNELSAFLGSIIFAPLMTQILRPLGEEITRLPAGDDPKGRRAGPPFVLHFDVQSFPHEKAARILMVERVQELSENCRALSEEEEAPARFKSISRNLEHIHRTLKIEFVGLEKES